MIDIWVSAISLDIYADTLSPLCSCSLATEDIEHYFLRCQNNLSSRTTVMNDLNNINNAMSSLDSNELLRVILYGDKGFHKKANCKKKLTLTVKFILLISSLNYCGC